MSSNGAVSNITGSPSQSLSFEHDLEQVRFSEEVDDRHKCLVCKNVLRNPVQTECGHRMCQLCLQNLFVNDTNSVACPGNEEDCINLGPASAHPDAFARKEIGQLKIYCTFAQYGCTEILYWKKLKDHLSVCEYAPEECPNKQYGCQEAYGKKNRDSHTNNCSYRPQQCKHCGQEIPKCHLKDHTENDCPKQVVVCQYNCGRSFSKDQIIEHLEGCPKRPRECKFNSVGCEFVGVLHEIVRHQKETKDTHLDLLIVNFANLQLERDTLKRQLQEVSNEKDIVRNQLSEQKEKTDFLSEHLNSVEKKLRNVQKSMVSQGEKVIKMEQHVVDQPTKEIFDQQTREVADVKEKHRDINRRLNRLEQAGVPGVGGMPEGLLTQLSSHDRQIGIQDVRLAEMDLRFQVLETANYDGVLIWKIRDYRRRKHEATTGKTLSLYSQPFYTSRYGYKMCARVYLNGDGMGKGTHVSLFFVVMRGDYDALLSWPFRQKCTLMLLDQDQGRKHLSDTFRPDPTSSSFKRPTSEMNVASGCPLFVSQQVLESGNTYMKDDTIFIKVVVDTSDLYGP